jgi:hypothetical protein
MAMLSRLLRLIAIGASLVVVAGWAWFAIDETSAASKQSAATVAGEAAQATPDPDPDQERAREKVNGRPRELVDDANDVLLRPFAPIADDSGSRWVRRSVPAVIALLVYGVGISTLARYVDTR